MTHATCDPIQFPVDAGDDASDVLAQVLRQGAQQMLATAIEAEVADYIEAHADLVDEHGHRQVVRNGRKPERSILTALGPIEVRQPRVHDRRPPGEREPFTSKILPPYLRKARNIEELVPWLYLKGISTQDFSEALQALVGPKAKGLSATTVVRLKKIWEEEHRQWSKRPLSEQYVYIWADGVHFNVRLEDAASNRQCILVLMGATAEGRKELIAVSDGYRESEQSWMELLLGCRSRGLQIDPKLAIGDGALGFWLAVRKVWPDTRHQRCWVHKTGNVLNKMPKSEQGTAKSKLHDIWQAGKRAQAYSAFESFIETYEAKYPEATACLARDREELLAFYDFPAEHWKHLRTTNPIESTFATVRLRTSRTKGSGSRTACLTMVFKLAESAQHRWRKLNGHELIRDVIASVPFVDGEKQEAA